VWWNIKLQSYIGIMMLCKYIIPNFISNKLMCTNGDVILLENCILKKWTSYLLILSNLKPDCLDLTHGISLS